MASRKPPSQPLQAAHQLLRRAHSPSTAERLFTEKALHKPLLLQPTVGGTDKRALRRHVRLRKKAYYLGKQKPKPLSAKEKRTLGLHQLDRARGEYRHEIYKGLHRLWCGYLAEVLGLDSDPNKTITAASHGSLLSSADFHGAELEVVRCACPGRVGIKGIVVRDTKFTFAIVTERDEVKIIPKRGTVFRYEIRVPVPQPSGQHTVPVKRFVFEVHGSQMEMRPADRATRKFKWKAMAYL